MKKFQISRARKMIASPSYSDYRFEQLGKITLLKKQEAKNAKYRPEREMFEKQAAMYYHRQGYYLKSI